jgi:hypothetical protein
MYAAGASDNMMQHASLPQNLGFAFSSVPMCLIPELEKTTKKTLFFHTILCTVTGRYISDEKYMHGQHL